MRQIRRTTEASDQLEAAFESIQQNNPTAAGNIARSVIDRTERLAVFPGLGRPGELQCTREAVSAPYIIVYRFDEDVVEILHIWHGGKERHFGQEASSLPFIPESHPSQLFSHPVCLVHPVRVLQPRNPSECELPSAHPR